MKHFIVVALLLFSAVAARADSTKGELFTYQNGTYTFLGIPDTGLPSLPPEFDTLIRPNSLGQTTTFGAVGNGPQQSFIVNADGSLTPLSLPSGCIAFGGINDSGQIAGVCRRPGYAPTSINTYVGFVDTAGSFTYASYKIPGDGSLTSTFFEGINNQGEVIGEYLTVPEPGTLIMLGIGLLGVALCRRP